MGTITVGIGEWAVSRDPGSVLKTYALGSCVAVNIYDKVLKIAGMIHVALPDSSIDQAKRVAYPGYFVDTGLPLMIEEMKKLGVLRHNVWVKLAGGASVMDAGGLFDIGKRNILAVKKVLWKSSLGPIAEDTGGIISRTVSFSIDSGDILITSGNQEWSI
ncbi:MAG TPA: chemotaxis protein CheD [Spirochaetia bacterium]|nr:chemotaxis protein CheD [Spirochaetia bacterium]